MVPIIGYVKEEGSTNRVATREFNPACFLLMFSGPIVVTYHYNFILYIIIYPHYISTMYGEYPINSPNWTYDHQSPSFPSWHNWGISEKPSQHNSTQLVGFLNLEMGEAIPSVYCWPNMKVNVHVSRWEQKGVTASRRSRDRRLATWFDDGRPEAMKTNVPSNTAVRSFGSPQGLQYE